MTVDAVPTAVARRRRLRAGRGMPDRRLVFGVPVLALFAVMAVVPDVFDMAGPRPCVLGQSLEAPSLAHPFGHDVQGCDLFARTVHGTRNSLLVGFGSVALAGGLAVVAGALAGMFRGVVDTLVGGLVDLLTGIPVVLVGLVLLTVVAERGVLQVVLVLTLFGWPTLTAVMRSEVIRVTQREYVTASRAMGAGRLRILSRHVVPNATAPLVAVAVLSVATMITTEAIVTFVGAGLQQPDVSWGVLLAEARNRLATAPHLVLPGAFLVVAAGALIAVGDVLRDRHPPH